MEKTTDRTLTSTRSPKTDRKRRDDLLEMVQIRKLIVGVTQSRPKGSS